jgi:hypothetical protein
MRFCTITILCCLAAPGVAKAQTPYDGVWNVTIQTSAGSCERSAQYAVTVTDGKVSGPQNVSGTV